MKIDLKAFISFTLFLLVSGQSYGFSSETTDVKSPFTQEVYKISVLTLEDSEKLFKMFANNSLIPFDVISDGCYARAYLMITQAKLKKVELGQTIAEVLNPNVAVIEIPSLEVPWIIRWQYHVAPYVYVKNDLGELRKMIFDPILFDHPVTEDVFVQKLKFDSNVELDVFDLPSYVLEKDQWVSEVNLERLDSKMLKSMNAAQGFAELHGKYLEKTPLLDKNQNKCFQGGLIVDRSRCGN